MLVTVALIVMGKVTHASWRSSLQVVTLPTQVAENGLIRENKKMQLELFQPLKLTIKELRRLFT